jgi:hypothetical protein
MPAYIKFKKTNKKMEERCFLISHRILAKIITIAEINTKE